ncbi:nucleotide exchange factor GrpE [Candidatus Daviesbacteria bacterium]|nr:nucleotide exchange factor GrpE [Candidatus Daviesbacteria bacterium]
MGKKQDDDAIKGKRADDIPDLIQVMEDLTQTRDELEKVKSEQLLLDNQLKRAVADYQNLEKRVAEGRSELTNWATTGLIKKLLTVLDHFEKVVDLGRPVLSEEDKSKEWFRGVELATQQLQQVLKDEGLEEIAADGQFDPTLHEAVDTREGEHDRILEVVEKGYNLNGKVLKPAKVVVGKKRDN